MVRCRYHNVAVYFKNSSAKKIIDEANIEKC